MHRTQQPLAESRSNNNSVPTWYQLASHNTFQPVTHVEHGTCSGSPAAGAAVWQRMHAAALRMRCVTSGLCHQTGPASMRDQTRLGLMGSLRTDAG